ncbi:translation elongation factor [Bacillus tianshenii]|nr:translation elongation factor [Bacillus tianshenii]
MAKTKNDTAWEILFERYDIINAIKCDGFFRIKAADIRKEREPRLMCKFDHYTNLPNIFKLYKLGILPLSRSEYLIGPFHLFESVRYQNVAPTRVSMPAYIETLQHDDLYSESAALHAAHVSGMFHDLLGLKTNEHLFPTVSGRMGSKSFQFNMKTNESGTLPISVQGAQIEVDGGYESKQAFILTEAKKEKTTDFNIRQLFYPYRVWRSRIDKPIHPIFFTHSNDIFSFFVYSFDDEKQFDSLRLVQEHHYMIDAETITFAELTELAKSITPQAEPDNAPFPQADKFERVVDLLGLLYKQPLTKEEITENYDFTPRQTDYYTSIGRYLRLIDKRRTNDGISFSLTTHGQAIMSKPYKQKYITLIQTIFEQPVFNRVFSEWAPLQKLPKERVVEIMKEEQVAIGSESTYFRRAQTVLKWMEWIANVTKR